MFFISFVILGCNKHKVIEESQFLSGTASVINPGIEQNFEQKDLLDLLDSVRFVKLELGKESIVGRIDKVIVFENHIYVLDKLTNTLFIFNLSGKYISKISKPGNGPEEYIQLDFFDIDFENRQIVLTDLMGYWILRYDLKGNYLSRVKIPFWIEGIIPVQDKGYAVYANFRDNKFKIKNEYNVFYLDSSMQISKAYFPYNSADYNNPDINFATPQTGNFYFYNTRRFFFSSYNGYVYEVADDGLQPKYFFDFGENAFDEKYLQRKSQLPQYIDEGAFFRLAEVMENDDFLAFTIFQPSVRISHTGFYSKNSMKVICSPGFTVNGEYFHGINATAYDTWIVAVVDPANLLSWSEYIQKDKVPLESEYAKLKNDIAGSITLEDNQVLMFYKLNF